MLKFGIGNNLTGPKIQNDLTKSWQAFKMQNISFFSIKLKYKLTTTEQLVMSN